MDQPNLNYYTSKLSINNCNSDYNCLLNPNFMTVFSFITFYNLLLLEKKIMCYSLVLCSSEFPVWQLVSGKDFRVFCGHDNLCFMGESGSPAKWRDQQSEPQLFPCSAFPFHLLLICDAHDSDHRLCVGQLLKTRGKKEENGEL